MRALGTYAPAGSAALLAAAALLLPVAPLEIADSAVNTPWYLLFALFWAALWRPRGGRGLALAALIAFLAGASTPMALAIAPLLAVRIVALPRVREHAVTAGLAVGLLLQLPVIAAARNSRVSQLAGPHGVLDFVAHDVVLPALGWHLDWWLQSAVGRGGATLAVGCVLAAVFGAIAITAPARVRLLAAAALGCGFLLATAAASLSRWVTTDAVHFHIEPGSRYTTLPIFLMQAAVIVAVDNILRRARDRVRADDQAAEFGVTPWTGWARARGATAAVTALVAVLSIGWVTDFRNGNGRRRGVGADRQPLAGGVPAHSAGRHPGRVARGRLGGHPLLEPAPLSQVQGRRARYKGEAEPGARVKLIDTRVCAPRFGPLCLLGWYWPHSADSV